MRAGEATKGWSWCLTPLPALPLAGVGMGADRALMSPSPMVTSPPAGGGDGTPPSYLGGAAGWQPWAAPQGLPGVRDPLPTLPLAGVGMELVGRSRTGGICGDECR